MRDTSERLRDILEAISLIAKYTDSGRQSFDEDELIQSWVIRHLAIIGEAASSIPKEFKDKYPAIEWHK